MSRSRDWCFTINNPTEEDQSGIDQLEFAATYYIAGREVGEQGTPHIQGFVRFPNPRTLQGVKRILRRAHLETRRGTITQAIEYCKKEGNYREWGDIPTQTAETTKERWRRIISLAETGEIETIKNDYPGMYLRYLEKLRSMALPRPVILTEITNEWWYGSTGTGKSRKLWQEYPNHFQKELNKWWCGYQNENVVAIEEWSPKNECTASSLKIWADRYPFTAQIKGGSLKKIRPWKIIVLSNYTIEQCFPQAEDRDPIKRRFKTVHFPSIFSIQAQGEYTETNNEYDHLDAINSLLALSQ